MPNFAQATKNIRFRVFIFAVFIICILLLFCKIFIYRHANFIINREDLQKINSSHTSKDVINILGITPGVYSNHNVSNSGVVVWQYGSRIGPNDRVLKWNDDKTYVYVGFDSTDHVTGVFSVESLRNSFSLWPYGP